MNARFDPIAILEQSYVQRSDRRAWMHEMVEHVTDSLDPSQIGAFGFFLTPNGPTEPRFVARAHSQKIDEFFLRSLFEVFARVPPTTLGHAVRKLQTPGLYSFEETLGYIPDNRVTDELGYRDSLAVVVPGDDTSPPALFATLTYGEPIDRSQRSLWRRIATHLRAGCRLSGRGSTPEAEDVECVLAPSGRVLHARGEAQGDAARDKLRAGVLDVDRARRRRGRCNPDAALELWRGLFSGRWSLVDHFDSDGRRFLLARRNEPDAPGSRALPLRQRQVLFYIGAGWSNKEVGYALGISETTVAIHLRLALTALNVASRADWIRISAEVSGV